MHAMTTPLQPHADWATPRLGTFTGHAPQTYCEDGLVSKLTPVMTIMGLQCAADVARRAQLGELGWETSSALQLDHMNTAYGYIAQVVVFLGNVLDVPPLYHLELEGSFCRVQQHMPRTLRTAVGEPEIYEVWSLQVTWMKKCFRFACTMLS